ncbi:hypothetical protein ACOBR2_00390 [Telmatobacter bradus]|uniref:hypothetical protein n=1 Tax=Telmatobacter bradus TaxID=474953 RepID=UPI003B438ACB
MKKLAGGESTAFLSGEDDDWSLCMKNARTRDELGFILLLGLRSRRYFVPIGCFYAAQSAVTALNRRGHLFGIRRQLVQNAVCVGNILRALTLS